MDMSSSHSTGGTWSHICMSLVKVENATYLPYSDPLCNTDACLEFEKKHKQSQHDVSYYYQYRYGHFTIWYCLAVLGFGIITHLLRLNRKWYPPSREPQSTVGGRFYRKARAFCRMLSYRSIGGTMASQAGLPRVGMLIFLLITMLYFLILTFLVHPYYRERRGFGSPPIGVRTGLMSTALIPFIIASATKVNIISFLTGLDHTKLNIFHRWSSHLCFFLAIVHTSPVIVTALGDCGAGGLYAQFFLKKGSYEWTGIPPLALIAGITMLSVSFIRHRFYTFFYRFHIPLYIGFLATMFWHAGNQGDSWAYLWATLALYLASVCVRLFYKWQTFNVLRPWFASITSVQEDPGQTTKIIIRVPCDLIWKPGQHCFIRMTHLSYFQNHPFTISNLPQTVGKQAGSSEHQDMEFIVRAHRGLTKDLFNSVLARNGNQSMFPLTMQIDGPYGGLVEDIATQYNSLIFVAGGSGITACLAHIESVARSLGDNMMLVTSIHLVWMIRSPDHVQWALETLRLFRSRFGDCLKINVHVTDVDDIKPATVDTEKSLGMKASGADKDDQITSVGNLHAGCPYLPDMLRRHLVGRRILIFGCGPESLLLDLGDFTAKAQSRVFRGEADNIRLHTERFSW